MAYRTRTRLSDGKSRIWYGSEDLCIDQMMPKNINVSLFSDSTYFSHGNAYSSKESIVDDVIGHVGKYKYVSHLRSHATWLYWNTVYQMSPPHPPLCVRVHAPIVIASGFAKSETYDWSTAINALASKVDAAMDSSFQGAVFVKELRESITMIRNPFKLFSRAKIKRKLLLKQGQHFPGVDLTKSSSAVLGRKSELGDFWLEYRYGWNLLLADVENFAKALVKANGNGNLQRGINNWMRFAGKADCNSIPSSDLSTKWIKGSQASFNSALAHNEPWRLSASGTPGYIRIDRHDHEYYGICTCEQLRPFYNTLDLYKKILGVLSISNWRQVRDTLWEVIPLSFVVDWFINFSDIWRPFSEDRLSRFDIRRVGYSVSREYKYTAHIALTYPNYKSACGYPYTASTIVAQRGGVHADIAGSPGVHRLYERTPGFPPGSSGILGQAGLNLFQALDMTAIIRQIRRK